MIQDLIAKAFEEDVPSGDITTEALKVKEKFGVAQLIAKQDLIVSGQELFQSATHYCDPNLEIKWYFKDGDAVLKGQSVAQISGNLLELIKAERVALNFIGYLSGIATQTRDFVRACEGTDCKILDTRKTLPLYREWAKKAVCDGGGQNHRMNLSDAILIKENHINISGGFEKCIETVQANQSRPIEVETKNFDEVEKAVAFGVQRIMLDNMSSELMTECLKVIPKSIETEASGNMTLERIQEVAELGVNYISVGALTHSVPNADYSLLFDWN